MLANLIASIATALTMTAAADHQFWPPEPAICTQLQPVYQRVGISYYGGYSFCIELASIKAEAAQVGLWPTVPLNPEATDMHQMCTYMVPNHGDEYAIVWNVEGFESWSADYCYQMRADGLNIFFIDPFYS